MSWHDDDVVYQTYNFPQQLGTGGVVKTPRNSLIQSVNLNHSSLPIPAVLLLVASCLPMVQEGGMCAKPLRSVQN